MTAAAPPLPRAERPYPGLRPFEPYEAAIFRGRETLVGELIDRMECQSVLLVHGGSGSGKSSLVRAGMLPTMERLHKLAGKHYRHTIIRPSEGPFTALARAMAVLLGAPHGSADGASATADPPRAGEEPPPDAAAEGASPPPTPQPARHEPRSRTDPVPTRPLAVNPLVPDPLVPGPLVVNAAPPAEEPPPYTEPDAASPSGGPPRSGGKPRPEDVDAWSTLLLGDEDLAGLIERRVEEGPFETTCLVIDQFEEIFTWARDRRRSDVELMISFIEHMSRLATVQKTTEQPCKAEHRRRFLVLLTMRSDFLGACAHYPALARVINANQFYLPPLEEEGIAQAIVEPAAMFGGEVAPELARQLMIEAASSNDPLPLLQHKLMRMTPVEKIEQGEPWRIDGTDLSRVSADSNPLSSHADTIWEEIIAKHDKAGVNATEWIFRSLFDVEQSGEAIRRPRDFADLVAVVAGSSEAERTKLADHIVGQFGREGANFLIRSKGTEGAALDRVDISHEALLRNWVRIAGDPRTGEKGWKRREVEAGLLWRTLTYSNRWWDMLAPSTHKVARSLFAAMQEAPMRARRYLPPEDQRCEPPKSRDWKIVAGLIRRTSIFSAMLGLLIVAMVATLAWVGFEKVRSAGIDKAKALVQVKDEKEAATGLTTLLGHTGDELRQAQKVNLDLAQQLERVAPDDPAVKAALDTLEIAQVGPNDITGYIWVANGRRLMLADLSGTGVTPQQIRAGAIYRTRFDIALRTAMPSLPNVSAPRLGSVRKGDRVRALAPAQLWPQSGQYWLRVAPQIAATVYIQTARYDRAGRDAFLAKLREAGYTLPGVQWSPIAAGTSSVRYCNAGDAVGADTLARQVESVRGLAAGSIKVVPITKLGGCARSASKGVFELWLDQI